MFTPDIKILTLIMILPAGCLPCIKGWLLHLNWRLFPQCLHDWITVALSHHQNNWNNGLASLHWKQNNLKRPINMLKNTINFGSSCGLLFTSTLQEKS
jgi:hypothetical protein